MINDKCIYCKKENDFDKEHAFPESLLDSTHSCVKAQTKHEWIINDRHLCTKCNSDLGKLDECFDKEIALGIYLGSDSE